MKRFLRWIYYLLPRIAGTRFMFACRNYVFEVTYRCNLDCIMCSFLREIEHMKGEITPREELGAEELVTVVRRIPRHSNTVFTGGEPFMKKGFIELLRAAKERGHSVTVGTNGVLLSEDVCAELVALGVDRIGISIDGTAEIHNAIRRRSNAYEGAINAVRRLRAARQAAARHAPLVLVNAVILPENFRVLDEVVRVAAENGADRVSIQVVDGSYERSGSRLREIIDPELDPLPNVPLIVPADLKRALESAFATASRHNIALFSSPSGMSIDDIVAYYQRSFGVEGCRCFLPWNTCRISPYGDMYPCMNYRIGNVCDSSLYSLWTSERYLRFREIFRGGCVRTCCAGCCKLERRTA